MPRSSSQAPERVEITDLLWDWHDSGVRKRVSLDAVTERLEAAGQHRAARIVRGMPSRDGWLSTDETDALLLRVHCELQRLGEELQLARRVAETLSAWVRRQRPGVPLRVVDIGCGLGYVLRWLASYRVLGPGVELVGVDLNRHLVAHASSLAAAEGLPCRFVTGDAFEPGVAVDDGSRCMMISSGLLHHLPAAELPAFFAAQQRLEVAAFAHWDVDPSRWSTLGAWIFHVARMREPVSRHDGVLSARRAHPAATLLAAARGGTSGYELSCVDEPAWRPRLLNVLRPITGTRVG
jgi:SAM-dependent methyltransferase